MRILFLIAATLLLCLSFTDSAEARYEHEDRDYENRKYDDYYDKQYDIANPMVVDLFPDKESRERFFDLQRDMARNQPRMSVITGIIICISGIVGSWIGCALFLKLFITIADTIGGIRKK